MLRYLKENGFPVDIIFDTKPCAMMDGYLSDVYIEGDLIETYFHESMRDRVEYAEKIFEKEMEDKENQKLEELENLKKENKELKKKMNDLEVILENYLYK
jgi:peroxiredoxin family protein